MARIVTVYASSPRPDDTPEGDLVPVSMAYIRWLRISQELARLGHRVDVATGDGIRGVHPDAGIDGGPAPRFVPLSSVRWGDYDVVKTSNHQGFQTLERFGGADHPSIIAKLGSVVAPRDMPGVPFYGAIRADLYATQERIARRSRYVTVLTSPARDLWERWFGPRGNLLVVPGATDRHAPPPTSDPYPAGRERRIVFAGNVYTPQSQPEANVVLIDKLNRLGKLLGEQNARLYMLGPGDASGLDSTHVTYLGTIPYGRSWDYLYFADVGVVVNSDTALHNNESTKIYSYLRAGLPVISEARPNDCVVAEAQLGFVVEDGDLASLARRTADAATANWNRQRAVDYILANHTWDRRAAVYDRLIRGLDGETWQAAGVESL